MINLPVPYKSQWDDDAKGTQNDCGPASIAMILNYYGEKLTTDQVYQKTEAGAGLIGIDQMIKAIEAFGYTSFRKVQSNVAELKSYLDKGLPAIALVKYGSLGATVQDKSFKGGHFFVVVGYRDDGYFVNDPNFWAPHRQDGDHHFYPKADFEKAWSDAALDGNQPRSFQIINKKAGAANPSTGCLINNDDSGKQLFEKLVKNSGTADQTVKYLGLGENADVVSFDTIKKSLEARDGKLTSCKNELSTRGEELARALTEVSNRVEQVSRLTTELSDKEKLHLAEITALKSSQINTEEMLAPFKNRIEQLESSLKAEAKAKGEALIKLAEAETRAENAQKEQYSSISFKLWLQLFFNIKF